MAERRRVIRVDLLPGAAAHHGGTPRWLGPEGPFGERPLVERDRAEVMDPPTAARVEWAYRRARAWRGDQVTTEDAD